MAPDRPGGRLVLLVALGLTLLPLVVSAVQLLVVRDDIHPTSDLAAIEMTTRDVGHHAVLLGPFSRDGWHHPGPLSSYLYAVPYRLLGSTSAAMGVAALGVNGAAVAGMAAVARRRGGTSLALATLLVGGLLIRSLGPDIVRSPWNPSVTVLPYGLLVLLTWALLARDRWALPAAVLVASFVAQTHVGYVALGLPLLALGAAGLVVGTLRSGTGDPGARLRPLLRPGVVAVAVGALVWAPPVYEQLTREPGNLGTVAHWFRTGGDAGAPAQGVRAGWRLVSGQYGPVPEWVRGRAAPDLFTAEPTVLRDPVLPVLLPLVVLALVGLVRRRVPSAGGLGVAWLAASVLGVVATARVIGPVYAYRTGWTLVLGAIGGLALAWGAGRALADLPWWPSRVPATAGRAPARRATDAEAGRLPAVAARAAVLRRAFVPGALAALAVLAAVSSVTYARAGVPDAERAGQIAAVAPAVRAALPPGDGEVVVDGRAGGWGGIILAPGLVLELERHGVDAVLPSGEGLGAHRIHHGGPVRARLLVATGGSIVAAAAGEGRTLVAHDGLPLAILRTRLAAGRTVPDTAAIAVFLVAPP